MTRPSQSRSRELPVRGLIMIGVTVVLAGIVSSLAELWLGSRPPKARPGGDCVYQVIQDGDCMGTVFLPGPATVQEILHRLGLADCIGCSAYSELIPCGNCVELQRASGTLRITGIPGGGLIAAGKRIDLNRSKESDLVAVPGIGPVLAKRIVNARERQGGFSTVESLNGIQGIREKRLTTLRPWIMVAPRGTRAAPGRCP